MIEFTCECGQKLKVSNDLAGWSTQCTGCKELVSVPSPDEPAKAKAPAAAPAAIPWKAIAIGACCVAGVAIVIAVLSGGSKSPDEELAFANAKLKKQLADQQRELDALNSEKSKTGDAAKLSERARAAETERDRLRRELQDAQRQLEAARAKPAPDKPREVAQAPETKAAQDPPKSGEVPQPLGEAEVQDKVAASVVHVSTDRGSGGGFFVSADGLTVCSYRTVAKSINRKVTYIEGKGQDRVRREVDADVVAVDLKNDLALLKASVPRLVTFAQLETGWGIAIGQELLMFGYPPPGTDSVSQSLAQGGAQDLEYVIEGFKYILTAIPIGGANAGLPIFSKFGKVIGMAVVKGDESQPVGVVIPAAYIGVLLEGRETTFAIRGSLAEWEARASAPVLLPIRPGDIKVDGLISRMHLDEENDRIVGLDIEKNGLVVISLSKKKVLRTVTTGSDPVELQATGNKDAFWVSHAGARNIVKVNVEEGRVYDRVDVPGPFRRFAATQNHVWAYGGADGSFMISLGRDKKAVRLTDRFQAMGYDRRRDRLLAIVYGMDWRMIVAENPDKTARLLRDYHEIKQAGREHQRYEELMDLEKELKDSFTAWPAPPETSEWFMGGTAFTIVIDGSPLVYVNRSVIKATKLDQIIATFKREPYKAIHTPGVAEALQKFINMDRIQSGSPDGRWIATGTHIYSTETFSLHKELPIVSPCSAFSGDSKKLYIFDTGRRAIVPVDVESKDSK